MWRSMKKKEHFSKRWRQISGTECTWNLTSNVLRNHFFYFDFTIEFRRANFHVVCAFHGFKTDFSCLLWGTFRPNWHLNSVWTSKGLSKHFNATYWTVNNDWIMWRSIGKGVLFKTSKLMYLNFDVKRFEKYSFSYKMSHMFKCGITQEKEFSQNFWRLIPDTFCTIWVKASTSRANPFLSVQRQK